MVAAFFFPDEILRKAPKVQGSIGTSSPDIGHKKKAADPRTAASRLKDQTMRGFCRHRGGSADMMFINLDMPHLLEQLDSWAPGGWSVVS